MLTLTRIGVVGTGGWGKNHLRVFDELGVLAAFCDIDPSRLALYRERYGVNGYSSTDEMLSKETLDGITVCTPTVTHFNIAFKSLNRSLHTFVEKPLTYASPEGEELVKLADAQGACLAVGYIERFNPAVVELKRILEAGELGRPLLLEFHRENRLPVRIRDVGVILDTSVHDIDTARWLFKEEPESVFARVGRVTSGHEDFAAITLSFRAQKTALIVSNWVTPKRVRQLTAICTNGIGTVDFISQEVRLEDEKGTRIPKLEKQEPLTLELKHFVDVVEGKAKPLVNGREAVRTARIAEAALESGQTGRQVAVNP